MGLCRRHGLCLHELLDTAAEYPTPSPVPPAGARPAQSAFRPSIAVVIGVLTIVFSITFLIILYARHCKRNITSYGGGVAVSSNATAARRSGVGRAVVESLPIFRFSSLHGQKEGLECAVCLGRFEPAEALRLLPRCRHGFHVECVDTWLEAHSSCPLCRSRVSPEDAFIILDTGKPEPTPTDLRQSTNNEPTQEPRGHRFSGRHSSAFENATVPRADRFEQRPRRSIDFGSLRRHGGRKDGALLAGLPAERATESRFGHCIVVTNGSGGFDRVDERWSDLLPSDLLFLGLEMIITDSGRFSASRAARPSDDSASAGASVILGRTQSEISIAVRRDMRRQEERALRRWIGFAGRRTARWLRGSRALRSQRTEMPTQVS